MKITVFWDVMPCSLVQEQVKPYSSNLKMEAVGSSETLVMINRPHGTTSKKTGKVTPCPKHHAIKV
jgi:hypothetical protein